MVYQVEVLQPPFWTPKIGMKVKEENVISNTKQIASFFVHLDGRIRITPLPPHSTELLYEVGQQESHLSTEFSYDS